MLPSNADQDAPHIDSFIFQRDVFCLIRLHTQICTSYGEVSAGETYGKRAAPKSRKGQSTPTPTLPTGDHEGCPYGGIPLRRRVIP